MDAVAELEDSERWEDRVKLRTRSHLSRTCVTTANDYKKDLKTIALGNIWSGDKLGTNVGALVDYNDIIR